MDARDDEHPMEVLLGLNALRERSEMTDVVLEVEGRIFPCHRAVLASSSPYFRTMFTCGYAEAKQTCINIQDVSQVAIATILDYAYTGCLRTEPDEVQAVMSAASLLQMNFVSQKAAEYITDHLDMSNCADVLMYADMLGDLTLQQASGRYMASRFNEVVLQPSFLQLSPSQLQSVLNRDDLLASSEDDIVQATLRWIKFDQKERLPHLPALCKSFRCSFISSQCRVELESKYLSADTKLVYSNIITMRLGQMRSETMIFLKDDSSTKCTSSNSPRSVPCYDQSQGKLYSMSMPDNLAAFSMAVTPSDELYLGGGIDCSISNRRRVFFQYNHLLNTWESRCDMVSPRARCGLVYHHGYIYAIGGDSTNQTAERYDPSCDEWTSIAPLPYPISAKLYAVSLDDGIYVISKEGCYCFSSTANMWNKTENLLTPVPTPQAVTYQGCIFCVILTPIRDKERRGSSSIDVQIYNPANGKWRHCGNEDAFCRDAMLVPIRGSLYLLTVSRDDVATNLEGKEMLRVDIYLFHPGAYDYWQWIKNAYTYGMIPPMAWWLMSGSRTDCLVARMVPPCLGDGAAYEDKHDDNPSDGHDGDSESESSEQENSVRLSSDDEEFFYRRF